MAAATNNPTPASAKTTFVRMSLLSISDRGAILPVPALLGGFFSVPLAGAAQNVAQGVVPFVARVFEQLRRRSPATCIRRSTAAAQVAGSSTVNRYSSVLASIRVNRSTTCSCSVEPRNRVLSVKFVVSTTSVSPSQRPTESPIHLRTFAGRCCCVHPDDPRVVIHLVEDHDAVFGLHDLVQVVVEHRQRRRARRRAEAEQAPLAERTPLRIVVRAGRAFEPGIGALLLRRRSACSAAAALRCRAAARQRRHAAVRRIDDDRRALLAVDGDVLVPLIDPEIVVAADVARRAGRSVAANRRRGAVAVARPRARVLAIGDLLLELAAPAAA